MKGSSVARWNVLLVYSNEIIYMIDLHLYQTVYMMVLKMSATTVVCAVSIYVIMSLIICMRTAVRRRSPHPDDAQGFAPGRLLRTGDQGSEPFLQCFAKRLPTFGIVQIRHVAKVAEVKGDIRRILRDQDHLAP